MAGRPQCFLRRSGLADRASESLPEHFPDAANEPEPRGLSGCEPARLTDPRASRQRRTRRAPYEPATLCRSATAREGPPPHDQLVRREARPVPGPLLARAGVIPLTRTPDALRRFLPPAGCACAHDAPV